MVRVTPFALRASLALLGAAALAAGCGPSAPDPVTDKDGTLRLRLGDPEYAMEPGAIKVRSGRIRILARNEGTLTHNVKVEEATDEEGAVPIVYGGTATMQPGERAPGVTVRLFPGRYRLVCTIGNHENLGQYAELEVTRAGS
jgi:plastocyanin